MAPHHDRLTLDALLSDPLTQLVMRSDGVTQAEMVQAFAMARGGLPDAAVPVKTRSRGACATFDRWLGAGISCWMG